MLKTEKKIRAYRKKAPSLVLVKEGNKQNEIASKEKPCLRQILV